MHRLLRNSKRVVVAISGGLVVLVGIIAIPYPGPGWLIVFVGLGILATEFDWARRVLNYARLKYEGWQDWISRQPLSARVTIWLLTTLIVMVTIWLLNGYGIIVRLLHLNLPWLESPL